MAVNFFVDFPNLIIWHCKFIGVILTYFSSFITAMICSWFSSVFKIWYESQRCWFSIQFFSLFQRQHEICIFTYRFFIKRIPRLWYQSCFLIEKILWCIFDNKMLLFKSLSHLFFKAGLQFHAVNIIKKLFYGIDKICDITTHNDI